jgi:hypothetical protein
MPCFIINAYMKKKLVYVFISVLVLLVSVYFLIPGETDIEASVAIKCNGNSAERAFRGHRFQTYLEEGSAIDGYAMKFRSSGFHEMVVFLRHGPDTLPTHLAILNLGRDSIGLRWQYVSGGNAGFLEKRRLGRQAPVVKKVMDSMLYRMKAYLERSEHIYGLVMRDSMSRDSTLLVSRFITRAYPSTADIYRYIGPIRQYAASQGAHAINYPMLHVEKIDTGYACIVGLSVDRELSGTDVVLPKRYVPWKIVTAEVHGGAYSAEQGMLRLAEYIQDHSLAPQGLPFQSLMTERDKEADTTRWVTWVVQAVP